MSQTTGNTSHELRQSWFQSGDVLQSDSGGLYRGERFTLLGFGERYIGRGGFTHKSAGTYIDFATLRIICKFGKRMFARADSFERQPYQATHEQIDAVQIKISDLPETPFWEGDTVSFRREKCLGLADEMANRRHTVSEIDYNTGACGDFRVRMMSIYGSAGGSISGIRLVERGNIWKYQHGEPLDFTDIEKEAEFYRSLGMTQKACIRNGENSASDNIPHYVSTGDAQTFTFDVAMGFLELGMADEAKIKDRKQFLFVLIQYDNQEFGHRMREHTLRKFGLEEEPQKA